MLRRVALVGLTAVMILLVGCAPQATMNTQASTGTTSPVVTKPIETVPAEALPMVPVLPTVPPVSGPDKVVEPIKDKDGTIDWGAGMIKVTGKSAIDQTMTNPAQARLMAERGAVVDGQRKLLEITKGVRVDGETMVEDYIVKSDVVFSRVEGIVKGARQIGEAKVDTSAGIVTVTLALNLYGEEGVADAIRPEAPKAPESDKPISAQAAALMQKYSGIVIEGAGTGANPSLFPKLFDEKGNLLLDTRELIGKNAGWGTGAVQFVDNVNAVLNNPELGKNPLIIKVKQVAGKYLSDYVIPKEQSGLLETLKQALPYILKAGRFIFSLL